MRQRPSPLRLWRTSRSYEHHPLETKDTVRERVYINLALTVYLEHNVGLSLVFVIIYCCALLSVTLLKEAHISMTLTYMHMELGEVFMY